MRPPALHSARVPALRDARRTVPAADLAEEREAWVVLASVEGAGERTLSGLIATHGSVHRALALAARGRLGRALRPEADAVRHALPVAVLERIEAAARDPGARIARLAAAGVWAETLLDPDYPRRLLSLLAPPPVVFGQGVPASLDAARAVAIVGTRRASAEGRFDASRIAAPLAAAGVTVVSGLAVGIDGAAHAAALEAGGVTVAAIGSGHLRPGPTAHRRLVRHIVERGALIGELPPDAHATHGTYPRRNRLIVALADAVVVVEAPERSGALITARLGLEQGVPVYAVVPAVERPLSAGCRRLVEEGYASRFVDLDSLGSDLAGMPPWPPEARAAWTGLEAADGIGGSPDAGIGSGAETRAHPGVWPPLGSAERECARQLLRGPATMDALLVATSAAPGEVAAALTLLQLRGLVRTLGPLYLLAGALLAGMPG